MLPIDLEHLTARTLPALLCFSLCLAGCGIEKYEQRLEATRQYYAYLDKLDQNLASTWRTPPVDSLRVPKQFQEIPAPQPVKGPDGALELPAVDPRQPTFINLPIKGLIGAWQGDVEIASGDQRGAGKSYLYAASNYGMFLTEEAQDAIAFTKDFLAMFEAVLQTSPAEEPPLTFPKGNQFMPRQTFDVSIFRPEMAINETRYIFEVYTQQQADNQVVLIFARPEAMDPQSKINERLQLMLESLRVSAERPQPQDPGKPGSPAAGPKADF